MAERHPKEQVGIVLSSKMDKTVVVRITRLIQHRAYKKVIRVRKRYSVHDAKKLAKVGDKVRIAETKPISKSKRWKLVEVISSIS